MPYRLINCCLVLAALAATAVAATPAPGDEVPAWLKQAAGTSAPAYDKKVEVVVLHDEGTMTVNPDGRVTNVATFAIRVLTRDGRRAATAYTSYATGTDKIKEMRAWLIRPDGSVKKYGKNETLDEAVSLDDVYNDYRARKISAADDADVGCVFGYQITTEERPFFPQAKWYFQGYYPVLYSRMTVVLPAGWGAQGVTFNHPGVEPKVNGTSYSWELRNLAPIEDEPASPSVQTLAPRLAINYAPQAAAGFRSFGTWADVSRWYTELADPQSEPDDAIAAKARELTAGAKTELEKIQAVGRFVQGIQYISIQIGIGGYRPHKATEVFAKKYGDCKDKATLMRAMLKTLGMQSYHVLIFSGDRTYVRQEWASPSQFNHCIIAVRVGAGTAAPSVVEHAQLGRLLIFDATDEDTPVGDLPDHEQGSFALVAAGDTGALLRMPTTPPETNHLERTAEVTLDATGAIRATVRDRAAGQSAVQWRRLFKARSRPDFGKAVERWITGGTATGAVLSKVEPTDDQSGGRFSLDMEFAADRYAQSMMDRLLVFKPALVARGDSVRLAEPTRKHPVVLESEVFSETVRYKLPDGFAVDEMPDAVKLNSDFATYTASYEVKDGHLLFTRKLIQLATTIPAEQYKSVRDFFGRIRASEEAPIVLAKK